MARSYRKQSDYWERRKIAGKTAPVPPITINNLPPSTPAAAERKSIPFPSINYGAEYISEAAGGSVAPASSNTRGRIATNGAADINAFDNLLGMRLPWEMSGTYVGVKDAIDLCCRAYTGVPIFRNAIEVAVEFSNTPLHIKTDNRTVKKFFEEWFYAIQINKLKEEWFREYYRSGNVFLYKFSGKFGPAQFRGLQQTFGAKENKLPIRYSLLNPVNIFVQSGLTFPYTYVRLLSTYEIERLKNPLTPQDKQVFDQLPQLIKDQIRQANNFPLGLYIPVEPDRLRFAFYKKQSYEPLATPMGYPVLPYIEWKLILQKMDKALAREVEQAFMLVTTGESPNEYNGGNGINQNNIARLQSLLSNSTISRVLVGDYTTKAQWLIPPIEKILGPEKYEIVNQDIKEGLSSVLLDTGGGGGSKFATAQIKAKIFLQRLEEGQRVFVNDFLMPEIALICENMGFRHMPTVEFEKISLQDESVMARVYTQMAQLGLLTPDQLMTALENGILPTADEIADAQPIYKAARDKGLFVPLAPPAGGDEGGGGRPPGSKSPQTTKKISPMGGKGAISSKLYMEGLVAASSLKDSIGAALKKQFKVKTDLSEIQLSVAEKLARSIMATQPRDKWDNSIAATIEKPPALSPALADEIVTISSEYGVDLWDATILRECFVVAPTTDSK